MKIIIETPCQEDEKRVRSYVEEFCKNNFQKYDIKIEVEEK